MELDIEIIKWLVFLGFLAGLGVGVAVTKIGEWIAKGA